MTEKKLTTAEEFDKIYQQMYGPPPLHPMYEAQYYLHRAHCEWWFTTGAHLERPKT